MALQHLRSSTAHKRPIPTVMSAGQIAINTNEASPALFFKDSNGDLVKVGPVHVGTSAPNSSPASVAATALVTGTVYQILTVGTSDFTLVGASANTVGTIFTATGTTTGTGTVSGQQGVEKGEMWLDTTGGTYVLKIYDGTDWRSESGTFVDVSGDTMTGDLVFNNADIVFEGATADDFETTLTVTNPTADRTITLPDVTGTVVTTGDTGSVTSTMITNGTIVNADINASAEIAVSKLANGTARQLLQTDSGGTGVEFTSNVDVPGTLDVTNAGTFDSTVSVAGLLSADGKLNYPAGTAAAPSLYSGSDTDTGIYAPASDEFGIATAGASRVVIDSSGNVGIGTTSPAEVLEVRGGTGNIRIRSNDAGSECELRFMPRNSSGTSNWNSSITGITGALTFGVSSAANASPTERMRIDSSGRLLVGTSNSSDNLRLDAKLAIVNAGAGSTSHTGLNMVNYCDNAGVAPFIDFKKSRSNTDGGTTVVQDGDDLGYLVWLGTDGDEFHQAAIIQVQVDGTPGNDDMPGRLVFGTTSDGASSATERMRIANQGDAYHFATTDVLFVASDEGAGTAYELIRGLHSATAVGTGTTCFKVFTNGNVQNTNNSYGIISDVKVKENIIDAGSQWSDIKNIRIRSFNLKAETGYETHRQIGVIAQEVEEVSPGLVYETADRDEEGNDLGTVTKGVHASVLYMKAVKALQEAMERIETLEAKVAALEAQ